MDDVRIKWTDEDLVMLKEAYGAWPVVYPPTLLQRHSLGSCYTKAHRLQLTHGSTLGKEFGHITDTEWAYMAGIVDGEGTVHIFDSPKGRKHSNRVVSVSNTDQDLIDWMQRKFPGSGLWTVQPSGKKGEPFRRIKPCMQVRWTRTALIKELLEGMLPYLIIKRAKAEEMLTRFSALT